MTSYEIYVLILCLIVFTLLTTVFASTLVMMAKQSLRLIEAGAEDERIYKERKKAEIHKKKTPGWLSVAFTVLFACVATLIVSFTLFVKVSENRLTGSIPTLRVVYSDSMSAKYEKNTYLFTNDLNDQFARFDIVITYQLPKEEDLKLYDIVVYEVDDALLIHRIVGIEEPNEKHPNERHFLLQGDLVERADKFPVRYNQMKGIYRGEHVPFIGSFVIFLQSPAGYICILLVLVEMFTSPIITRKIEKAENARWLLLNKKKEEEKAEEETQNLEETQPQEELLVPIQDLQEIPQEISEEILQESVEEDIAILAKSKIPRLLILTKKTDENMQIPRMLIVNKKKQAESVEEVSTFETEEILQEIAITEEPVEEIEKKEEAPVKKNTLRLATLFRKR